MLNLLIHSKFRKYIKVTKPSKLPPEIKDVINKINNKLPVNGVVFRPVPDFGLTANIFFGIFILSAAYFFIYLSSPINLSRYWYFYLTFLLLTSYFFFISFLRDVWWVKKYKDKYFVYIGDEGIIKKNMTLAAFIPLSKIKGAKFYYGSMGVRNTGNFVYLELIIKEGSLLNPALITNRGGVYSNIVKYDRQDLKKMADIINDKLNYVEKNEFKRRKEVDEKWANEKKEKFNDFSSNDDFMNVSSVINKYGFNKNSTNTSVKLEETFNLNGKIHKIEITKKGNSTEIMYNGEIIKSINEIPNEYVREKIKTMLDNIHNT